MFYERTRLNFVADKSAVSCGLIALVERCLTNKASSADVSMNQMMFRNSFSSMPNMSRYLVTRLTSNDDLSDSSARVHINEDCRSQPIQRLCMTDAHSAESIKSNPEDRHHRGPFAQ